MKDCAPYIGMIVVQFAYAGGNIISKLALERGLSSLTLIVYRHIIAMFIFGPLAYVFERKKRPSLTLPVTMRIFVLALMGITIQQNVYYAGMDYTSSTVASALGNVVPALTYIMAILLRLEKVSLRSSKGRARIVGTLLCISGALVFTFWKGHLLGALVRSPLIEVHAKGGPKKGEDWLKGSTLILSSLIAYSGWLILQALICQSYPATLSMNTLMCFFASIQSAALALIFERNASAWRMGWNLQLLTTVYCGVIISGLTYYLQTYCIGEKGPVFSAIFSPLSMLIVGFFSAFFFAERLNIGSLIGAFIIVVGLYSVLWGNTADPSDNDDENGEAEKNCEAEKSTNQV